MDWIVSVCVLSVCVHIGGFVTENTTQAYENETFSDITRLVPEFEHVTFPQATLISHTYPVYENYFENLTTYEELTTARLMNAIPTFDDVDEYLSRLDTKQFLAGFQSEIHRQMVREQLRLCPFTSLCGFSLNIPTFNTIVPCCQPCSCDFPFCFNMQTCCPDIIPDSFFDDFSFTYPNGIQTDLKDLERCTLSHAKYDSNFKQYSLLMYSTCPTGTDKYLEEKCSQIYTYESVSSISDMLPVQTAFDGIYRNRYCAKCRGADDTELEVWDVKLNCLEMIGFSMDSDDEILRQVFKSNTCDLVFTKSGAVLLSTCLSSINTCNITGLWEEYDPVLELKCHLFTSIYIGEMNYDFQNVFCLQCNGLNVEATTCTDINKSEGSDDFAFSGLLRLQSDQSLSKMEDTSKLLEEQKCTSTNEVFEMTTGKCLQITCSKLHRLRDGYCNRLFTTVDSMMYNFSVRLTPLTDINMDNTYNLSDHIIREVHVYFLGHLWHFPQSFCEARMIYHLKDQKVSDLTKSESLFIKHMYINEVFYIKFYHNPYDVAADIRSTNLKNYTIGDTNFDITLMDGFGLPYNIFLYEQTNTADKFTFVNRSGQIVYSTKESVHDNGLHTDIFVPYIQNELSQNDIYSTCPSDVDSVNILSLSDCPKTMIPLVGHEIQEDGLSMESHNYIIPLRDFFYHNGSTINVCLETYGMFFKSKAEPNIVNNLDISKTLSIVLVTISLMCILATLLTYIFLPTLQNLPGKNTISLSVNLLVAQSLYLLSSFALFYKGSAACVATGVALHFFWLSTIMWTNVCTFHMLYTLTAVKHMTVYSGKRFLCYNIYPVTVASTLVIANVVVSYYVTHGASIGYGLMSCYIAFNDMLQYTFVIPTFMAIVANFIMFLYVVVTMKRLPSVRSTKSDRNDLVIFIKLSSLTGITWVFGFLFSWTGIKAFSYAFIVFCSTMGVFLFVSFVTNRRVLNLFREKFESSGSTKSTDLSKKLQQKYVA